MRALGLALALAALGMGTVACKKAPEAPRMAEPKVGESHSAIGVIKALGEGNKTVVIEHQAFKDGFMEAMTMSFELKSPDLAKGLKIGDTVDFTLTYLGAGSFPITVIQKSKG